MEIPIVVLLIAIVKFYSATNMTTDTGTVN